MKKTWTLRLGALGLAAVATLIACEASQVTGLGSDGNAPFISLQRPDAALRGVSASRPVQLTIHGGDDMSLQVFADTIYLKRFGGGAAERVYARRDSFTTATPVFDDAIEVTLSSARDGDSVRIVGFVKDGNANTARLDTTLVVLPRMPRVTIDTVNGSPTTIAGVVQPTTVLAGDSLQVVASIQPDSGIGLAAFDARVVLIRGNPLYGTDTLVLYTLAKQYTPNPQMYFRLNATNVVPETSADTVIRLVVRAADQLGNDNFAEQPIRIASGPKITLTSDSIAWISKDLRIGMMAVDHTGGVAKLGYTIKRLRNGVLTTLRDQPLPTTGSDSLATVELFHVDSTLQVGDRLVIAATASDASGNTGSGNTLSIPVVTEPPDQTAPLVYQTMPARLEWGDTVKVRGIDPSKILSIGYYLVAADDTTKVIASGAVSNIARASRSSDTTVNFVVKFADGWRGHPAYLVSYAVDSLGNRGWSVQTGSALPESDSTRARRDVAKLVYGMTYAMPVRAGGSLAADLVVDTLGQRAMISNLLGNQIEVWRDSSGVTGFGNPVYVGSSPWGLALTPKGDTLLVANSGGTDISVVPLRNGALAEDLSKRIGTPNTIVFDITWSKDASTNVYRYSPQRPPVIDYSDRPQYIGISGAGNVYYSTVPTGTATAGTLRKLENALSGNPQARQVWQYASAADKHWTFINGTYVETIPAPDKSVNDSVVVCDYSPSAAVTACSRAVLPSDAVASLKAAYPDMDVEAVLGIDVKSLSLNDTNFVAVGGDGQRVVFGEGNTSGRAGRVISVFDPAGTPPRGEQYSGGEQIDDYLNNASMTVFGVAVNANSSLIGVQGSATILAAADSLRLKATITSSGIGAGIAFHPGNNAVLMTGPAASVFVATKSDTAVTIYHSANYYVRGKLPLKENLHGPLRAVRYWGASGYTVRLFGLSSRGMVVIDLQNCDLDNRTPGAPACVIP